MALAATTPAASPFPHRPAGGRPPTAEAPVAPAAPAAPAQPADHGAGPAGPGLEPYGPTLRVKAAAELDRVDRLLAQLPAARAPGDTARLQQRRQALLTAMMRLTPG